MLDAPYLFSSSARESYEVAQRTCALHSAFGIGSCSSSSLFELRTPSIPLRLFRMCAMAFANVKSPSPTMRMRGLQRREKTAADIELGPAIRTIRRNRCGGSDCMLGLGDPDSPSRGSLDLCCGPVDIITVVVVWQSGKNRVL